MGLGIAAHHPEAFQSGSIIWAASTKEGPCRFLALGGNVGLAVGPGLDGYWADLGTTTGSAALCAGSFRTGALRDVARWRVIRGDVAPPGESRGRGGAPELAAREARRHGSAGGAGRRPLTSSSSVRFSGPHQFDHLCAALFYQSLGLLHRLQQPGQLTAFLSAWRGGTGPSAARCRDRRRPHMGDRRFPPAERSPHRC